MFKLLKFKSKEDKKLDKFTKSIRKHLVLIKPKSYNNLKGGYKNVEEEEKSV